METSKILTASILDLLFDNRNKEYGAYELRKTYQQRIIRSLLVTITITGLIYAGATLAISSRSPHTDRYIISPPVIIDDLPEQKKQEKIPETPKPPQVRTEIFTPPVIVDKEKIENPPPTMEDLDSARIGLTKNDGINDKGIAGPTEIDNGKGVIDDKPKDKDNGPVEFVQVEAKYAGNWENFLRRNLSPVDNGAPNGRYTIIIQFIVDVDGTVSNIIPLTHLGYGMEEEAMRVLKKADKWEPAFQNGIHVKAYRRQPITFEVLGDD